MNKYKELWLYLLPEVRLDKECGFIRVKIFGIDLGISWSAEFCDGFALDIAFCGYGIAFAPWFLWLTRESYLDFWGY